MSKYISNGTHGGGWYWCVNPPGVSARGRTLTYRGAMRVVRRHLRLIVLAREARGV